MELFSESELTLPIIIIICVEQILLNDSRSFKWMNTLTETDAALFI